MYSRFIAINDVATNTFLGIYVNANYTDPVASASTTPSTTSSSVTVNSDINTSGVEEDIAKIESAIANVKNSINTIEIVAIVAVAVIAVIALGGIVTLIFKVSTFQRIPIMDEPNANNRELMKPENPSKNELAEVNEVGDGNGQGHHKQIEIEEIEH